MWKSIDTAPKDRPFLALECGDLYKAKFSWHDEDEAKTHYESHCGQPVCLSPEPTHWMELPEIPDDL